MVISFLFWGCHLSPTCKISLSIKNVEPLSVKCIINAFPDCDLPFSWVYGFNCLTKSNIFLLSDLSIFPFWVLGSSLLPSVIIHLFLQIVSSFCYLYLKCQSIWNLFWFKACSKHLDFFSHANSIHFVVCS